MSFHRRALSFWITRWLSNGRSLTLPKTSGVTVRMVFCGDGIRWRCDQLEDFADFYRTGIFRSDDPLRTLQAHYLTNKGLVVQRTADGLCHLQRSPLDLQPSSFIIDVRGP